MPLSLDDLSPEDRQAILEETQRLQELQTREVTPLEDWKSPRKSGFLIELPSGNVCRIRRTFHLLELIKSGSLPNPLRSVVEDSMDKGQYALNLAAMDTEARIQALDLLDHEVVAAMIEPRVLIPPEGVDPEVFQAPPGAISIMDLTVDDRTFIVTVAHGGTTDVTKFRAEQESVVESVRPVTSDRLPPKRASKPKRAVSKRVGNK